MSKYDLFEASKEVVRASQRELTSGDLSPRSHTYGCAGKPRLQFGDDLSDWNIAIQQWQQLVELTSAQPAALNAALKRLGSAIRLNEDEIPQVSAIFARCLAVKSHRRVANE